MIIYKNKLIEREEFNAGKLVAKSGSRIINQKGEEAIEMEFSSKCHTNTLSAV